MALTKEEQLARVKEMQEKKKEAILKKMEEMRANRIRPQEIDVHKLEMEVEEEIAEEAPKKRGRKKKEETPLDN